MQWDMRKAQKPVSSIRAAESPVRQLSSIRNDYGKMIAGFENGSISALELGVVNSIQWVKS